jgi:DNA polymerase III epsilon subunit-like protein
LSPESPESIINIPTLTPRHNNQMFNIQHNLITYIVFDIETTGFSRERNHIIELAAQFLDHSGTSDDNKRFHALVKPPTPIPPHITALTGIKYDDVCKEQTFEVVAKDFLAFVESCIADWEQENMVQRTGIVLCAHNGRRFDVPFLFTQMKKNGVKMSDDMFNRIAILDTLDLAKNSVMSDGLNIPENYKLATLLNYVKPSQHLGEAAHRADVDVAALSKVLTYRHFWKNRFDCLYAIDREGHVVKPNSNFAPNILPSPNDDSDTDLSSDICSSSEDEESIIDEGDEGDENKKVDEDTIHIGWTCGGEFGGLDTKAKFEISNQNTATTRSGGKPVSGIQQSKNSLNSPMKAWRQIFTDKFLTKIVKYTNEYGESSLEQWQPIANSDLTDFFSCLFIASIQKRKDKPSNWWSSNPLLEIPVMKKIMTGRKFQIMLRFLHVCSLQDQPSRNDPEYDPIYKVKEMKDYLEMRYKKLYSPGPYLSLDESLIRAFGRIKFKVRIITKAARYGIKLYVITDAETAFVLQVIVYTGKTTIYQTDNNEEMKKTVQIVKKLCEPYAGSHRVVYVDRFYTSVDLMKELDKMDLYVTGTVMRNRVPKELTIAKTSKVFKEMQRGDFKNHSFSYITDEGTIKQSGLVCWKDRDIVYCLSNNCSNTEKGSCYRRSINGIICLERPKVIEEYNQYMGGVDLADKRRLHCNSTIMGQNRWWLKLFFYLLDSGTANALVLFNLAMNDNQNNSMTIVDFKMKLVMGFVGDKITNVPGQVPTRHEVIRTTHRHLCAYCALYNNRKRTRYVCANEDCRIPICCVGNGKDNQQDCFALSHASEAMRQATVKKFAAMQLKTKNEAKP